MRRGEQASFPESQSPEELAELLVQRLLGEVGVLGADFESFFDKLTPALLEKIPKRFWWRENEPAGTWLLRQLQFSHQGNHTEQQQTDRDTLVAELLDTIPKPSPGFFTKILLPHRQAPRIPTTFIPQLQREFLTLALAHHPDSSLDQIDTETRLVELIVTSLDAYRRAELFALYPNNNESDFAPYIYKERADSQERFLGLVLRRQLQSDALSPFRLTHGESDTFSRLLEGNPRHEALLRESLRAVAFQHFRQEIQKTIHFLRDTVKEDKTHRLQEQQRTLEVPVQKRFIELLHVEYQNHFLPTFRTLKIEIQFRDRGEWQPLQAVTISGSRKSRQKGKDHFTFALGQGKTCSVNFLDTSVEISERALASVLDMVQVVSSENLEQAGVADLLLAQLSQSKTLSDFLSLLNENQFGGLTRKSEPPTILDRSELQYQRARGASLPPRDFNAPVLLQPLLPPFDFSAIWEEWLTHGIPPSSFTIRFVLS